MKRILFSLFALSVLTLTSHGQGTVSFRNTASTLVQYWFYPSISPAPVPVGGGYVELLWAPVGTTDANLFQVVGAAVSVGPTAGRFVGGTRTIPAGSGSTGIAPGGSVALFVRGWVGAATSWAQAISDSSGANPTGYSSIFVMDTGDPTTTPADTPAEIAAGGFTGFTVSYIPEPSSAALLLLGCGLLGWRQRRL